jgi:hypothetical protein
MLSISLSRVDSFTRSTRAKSYTEFTNGLAFVAALYAYRLCLSRNLLIGDDVVYGVSSRSCVSRPFLIINIALKAAFRRIVDSKSIKHLTYLLNLKIT